MIPIPPRLIAVVVALAAAATLGWSIKARLDAGAAAVEEAGRLRAQLDHAQRVAAVNSAVVSALTHDQEKSRVVTKEVIREVLVRVPSDAPPVPGYWRVLHDAAARGVLPDSSSGPDAAPVPAQDAANTVVENYGTCRDIANQLTALQQWVKGVTPNAQPDN